MYTPSFYAHVLNGLLLFVAVILVCLYYSQIKKINAYNMVLLLLVFSLAVGIHGISHLGMEYIYGYNPVKMIM
uniref:Uncharacterized protein n=1 Tax=viral metagenome TaxID=1070528 RepID=A0A6C0E4E8_9ZZZZ